MRCRQPFPFPAKAAYERDLIFSRAGTRETPVTVTAPPQAAGRLALFAPVLLAAGAFAFADVFVKVALNDGADALTIVTARGVLALPLIYVWLKLSGPITPLTPRERWISYGLGMLFAGNVYFLIEAIRIITVPVAILTYFIYPLLTGLGAAATGIEKLTWRGVTRRDHRVLRARADARRASDRALRAGRRRGGRRRLLPGGAAADHARGDAGRRCAADHLAFVDLDHRGVRRAVAAADALAAAGQRGRMVRGRAARASR